MNVTWQDVLKAADELIEAYKVCMNEYPENGVFYQEQLAATMWKRLVALEQLNKQNDQKKGQ